MNDRGDRTPRIVIRDNLYAQAIGVKDLVDEALSYRPDGYHFSKAYQPDENGKRHWDGWTHLLKDKDGGFLFPRGLVQYATDYISLRGITPELTDNRTVPQPSIITFCSQPQVEIEAHQEEALDGAVAAGQGIIYYPTASGKSVIIGELVRRLKVPTLILVDKRELLDDLHRSTQFLTGAPAGRMGGGEKNPGVVTVATFQSVYAMLKGGDKNTAPRVKKANREKAMAVLARFDMVIVDEVHHAGADSFEDVIQACVNAYYRFGFSATPFKGEDKETLLKVMSWLGPVVSYLSVSRGIDTGRLVPCDIFCVEWPVHEVPKHRIPINYGEELDEFIVNSPNRNRAITTIANRVRDVGPTVVLVERIEHGRLLADTLKSAFAHGGLPAKERRAMFDDFLAGKVDCLVVSKIGDEGLNLPNLEFLVLGAGGKAGHRQVQRIGRGMRSSEATGKDHVTVFDFVDKYGKYLPKHYRNRRKAYDSERAYQVEDLSWKETQEMFA